MGFETWVVDAFNALTPDTEKIHAQAVTYTLPDWLATQKGLVTASGAAAVAVPGLHLFGVAADVAFLMNRMSVCAYGVGAIIGKREALGNILEDEDFAFILAKWSGVEGTDHATIAKTAADLVTKVGNKSACKMLGKTMCKSTGILVGQKMGGKLGAKLGAKFGTKLGGKLVGGFIPFAGAAIGGGINFWFLSETARMAEEWYQFKANL